MLAIHSEQLLLNNCKFGVSVICCCSRPRCRQCFGYFWCSARAKGIDVLIADTAGRLKATWWKSLRKLSVLCKKYRTAWNYVSSGCWYRAKCQVQEFDQAVGLTGITITKVLPKVVYCSILQAVLMCLHWCWWKNWWFKTVLGEIAALFETEK